MTESWYDWPSVLAIVLILVVCPTKLHNKHTKFTWFKKINLMEIIFHQKTIFDTTLLQNLPHIKIAVRYDDLSFRLNFTGDPLHSRALAHSRAPLFKQPCPHCSHSRAPGEQWARLCVFTLQGCVQAARLCRGSPVNLYKMYIITCN